MELIAKLENIQKNLNAPKSQFNKFGKYHYRNCEDILQAVKPLLDGCAVIITDSIEMVGSRFYVKATAKITDGKDYIEAVAFAREAETKKGMDDSQLTGSTSSYARKYALNGLFLIDDNKDADSQTSEAIKNTSSNPAVDEIARSWIDAINSGTQTLDDISDESYRAFIKNNLGN